MQKYESLSHHRSSNVNINNTSCNTCCILYVRTLFLLRAVTTGLTEIIVVLCIKCIHKCVYKCVCIIQSVAHLSGAGRSSGMTQMMTGAASESPGQSERERERGPVVW